MKLRPWLRRTLWGAFFLSLLLHFFGIFGEDLYGWLTRPEFEQTALKKTQRKLKAQTLDDDPDKTGDGKKSEMLAVYLPGRPKVKTAPESGNPGPRRVASAAVASSVPMKPDEKKLARPVPAAQAASVVVASRPAVQPASAAQSASAVHAASAVRAASAPAKRNPRQNGSGLERYPRELKITYVWGVIPASMEWKIANGRYELRMEGGFLGAARKFVSSGRVDRSGVIPERFIEYRNGKPEPYYQVDFDWSGMTAEFGKLTERKTEPIAPGDQDIFSAAFHIGLVGGSRSEYAFSLFSGRKKYESAHLKLAGEAKLRLGEREVDALLLRGDWKDRRVDFWLAPEWHNIPVRMTIALGREDLTLDIWANEIVLDGRKVLEWVKPQQKEHSRNR